MKDIEEAFYVLGIKISSDKKTQKIILKKDILTQFLKDLK